MQQDTEPSDDETNYKEAYLKRAQEQQKMAQQEAQLKLMLRPLMDSAAFERLLNVKISNPELYYKVAQLLVMLQREGKLKSKVDETMLKALLARLIGQRKETKISFARK